MRTKRPDSQPNDLLIRGGRIIDPSQGIDAVGDLLISRGRIARLGVGQREGSPRGCTVVDARDMVVCPGFIDLHSHLRQPGFEEEETVASGTRAAARGGFTTVCCMPNTKPPMDTAATVEYVRGVAASEGVVRVLPIGCITKDREGRKLADFGELLASGVVAFSDNGSPVTDARLMRRALEYSKTSGLPVIDHCEDLALSDGGLMNEGQVAARLGLKGIPASAEERMVARDIGLASETGGRLHVAHVSTRGSVELVRRAKEKGLPVTAEATPHHLTLTEDAVLRCNTNAKVNPPLRAADDVAALVAGLRNGVIDAVATDHAPHTAEDKGCGFAGAAFGISGFETALGSLMGLVHRGQLDLAALIARLTVGPASILRRADLGTLKPGAAADVVVFDPEKEWAVDVNEFASKGKNTPLAGVTLRGKVMATIVGGVIAYSDARFLR